MIQGFTQWGVIGLTLASGLALGFTLHGFKIMEVNNFYNRRPRSNEGDDVD